MAGSTSLKALRCVRMPPPNGRGNCGAQHYALSNPWLVNLRVRLFSVTIRTTLSGTPSGISASISSVTRTEDPRSPTRCVRTSSAILLASRPCRAGCERDRAVKTPGAGRRDRSRWGRQRLRSGRFHLASVPTTRRLGWDLRADLSAGNLRAYEQSGVTVREGHLLPVAQSAIAPLNVIVAFCSIGHSRSACTDLACTQPETACA